MSDAIVWWLKLRIWYQSYKIVRSFWRLMLTSDLCLQYAWSFYVALFQRKYNSLFTGRISLVTLEYFRWELCYSHINKRVYTTLAGSRKQRRGRITLTFHSDDILWFMSVGLTLAPLTGPNLVPAGIFSALNTDSCWKYKMRYFGHRCGTCWATAIYRALLCNQHNSSNNNHTIQSLSDCYYLLRSHFAKLLLLNNQNFF